MSNIFKGFEAIPVHLEILLQLTRLLQDDYADVGRVVELVKRDPGLASSVVRLSNCAYFGCAEPSRTIDEAVGRIGFAEVMKLVSLISQRRYIGADLTPYGEDSASFWEESLATAVFMEFLAYEAEVEPALAYTIGLLSGIGKYPIAALLQRVKPYLRAERGISFLQLARWERSECQRDHAQTGSELLAHWGFHPSIHLPVGSHLRPILMTRERKTSSLLHIARTLAPLVRNPHQGDFASINLPEPLLNSAGVDRSIVEGYIFPAAAWLRTTDSMLEKEMLCA